MTYTVTVNTNAGYSVGISSPVVTLTQSANGAYAITQSNVSYNTSIGSTTYSLTQSAVGMQGDIGYTGSSGTIITVSNTAPSSPSYGALWVDIT
jgi:hypothetical protein